MVSQKALLTRQRILTAAADLFFLHGYNACGLDKVVKAANVTKGNFYYHFASKEALAIATLDWQLELIIKDIHELVLSQHETPLAQLFALLDLMLARQTKQYSTGHISGCYFGNFSLELSTSSTLVREKVASIFKQYIELIESLLLQAQQSGEISTAHNVHKLSNIILSQLEGAILLDKATQQPSKLDESITFIRDYLTA